MCLLDVRIEAGFLDAADVAIGPAPQQDHPVCQGRSGIGEGDRRHPLPAYGRVTSFADTHTGNRPSLSDAAPPAEAEPLYEQFCSALAAEGLLVQRGVFGARMVVELVNDGPVTIVLDGSRRAT